MVNLRILAVVKSCGLLKEEVYQGSKTMAAKAQNMKVVNQEMT